MGNASFPANFLRKTGSGGGGGTGVLTTSIQAAAPDSAVVGDTWLKPMSGTPDLNDGVYEYYVAVKPDTDIVWLKIINGVFHVDQFGAVGDGNTDDATAINSCIDAANAYGAANSAGATIQFGNRTYKVGSALNAIDQNGVTVRGMGRYATTIKFTATSGVCFTFAKDVGSILFQPAIMDLAITASSTTDTKTAIYAADISDMKIKHVLIKNFTGGDSIGIHMAGRELLHASGITVYATIPIRLSSNVNTATDLSTDHFAFDNCLLSHTGQSDPSTLTQAIVLVDEDCMVTNLNFEGSQAWIYKTYGLYYERTNTTDGVSYALNFNNVRCEQPDNEDGAMFHISSVSGSKIQDCVFRNCVSQGAGGFYPTAFYLRNVRRAYMEDCYHNNTGDTASVDVDSLELMEWQNCELSSAVNSIVGMRLIAGQRKGVNGSDAYPNTATWARYDGTVSSIKPSIKQEGVLEICLKRTIANGSDLNLPIDSSGVPKADFGWITIRATDRATIDTLGIFRFNAGTAFAGNGVSEVFPLDDIWSSKMEGSSIAGKLGIGVQSGAGLKASVALRNRTGVSLDVLIEIKLCRLSGAA